MGALLEAGTVAEMAELVARHRERRAAARREPC